MESFNGATIDLLEILPHGKLTDYPIPSQQSKQHFGNKICINKRLSHKLTQTQLFNVFCMNHTCQQTFNQRLSYEEWFHNHHMIKHPKSPRIFIIASFWSTSMNGHAYDTEYRLISLDDNKYLKPLKKIYAHNNTLTLRCGYCHEQNSKLLRCGGCKILWYCSKECQKKHWQLIHKKDCKKWKKKYKHKKLSQQEFDELDNLSTVKLARMTENACGQTAELFHEMVEFRSAKSQKQQKNKDELLFDDDSEHSILINTMMSVVIEAFDRDGDKKLNFIEWREMMKELGFKHSFADKSLFYDICKDISLLPSYEPALNNGSYGSYFYPVSQFKPVSLGPKEIIETLKFCAYFRSQSEHNEDEDFQEQYDFNDEKKSIEKAFILFDKLYGHAQAICCLGEMSDKDLYDAITEAVPYLADDIVSVIYNFMTYTGQHVIYVSWHRIKWLNFKEDQAGLWELYNRNNDNQYFDVFYLSKQDDKGYIDTSIGIQLCVKGCDETLKLLEDDRPFSFGMVDMLESKNPTQRWWLGQCGSYIPANCFGYKEHAILIGKILKFHNLNPKLCHYIYVGVGIRMERKNKHKIVDAFNKIYNSNTKHRPHAPKKRSNFLRDMLNFA